MSTTTTIDTQHEASCARVGAPCCRHPQTIAAESQADILIYGGAAGSGKSFFLTLDGAKHVHLPNYGGVFFRRLSTELTGPMSLWQEMGKLYPLLGGESRESPVLEWRFPSGALLQALHLQHAKNVSSHQSKRYGWIGFDEITTFEEDQFWFLVGRAGSSAVKPRVRGTCNPDPDSFVRKLIDWWIGEDGNPITERSGVLRWFVRAASGELLWFDSEAEAQKHARPGQQPLSFTFVAAKLADNAIFEKADPGYRAKLEALPPVLRARMLGGNWNVRQSAGDMFQRGWFKRVPPTALERVLEGMPPTIDTPTRVRFWDFAATPILGQLVPGVTRPADFVPRVSGDPDWTRGLLVGKVRGKHQHRNKSVLLDLKSWRDTPGAIREGVVRTAREDGPGTVVGLFLDPGQAAIDQVEAYKVALRGIARVVVLEVTKSKAEYATGPSQRAYKGDIWVDDPDDRWSGPFFNELEQFPPDKNAKPKPHDDCVDALSGAERVLALLSSAAPGEQTEANGVKTETARFMEGDEDEDDTPLRPLAV